MQGIFQIIAVGFGLGLIPKAPGTWGSLLGLPVAAVLFYFGRWCFPDSLPGVAQISTPAWGLSVVALLALSVLAWFAIHYTELAWETHDDSRIVIDEIVGQAMCTFMFEPHWLPYTLAFGLFRLLDISKPGLIGWADQHLPGSWGTLLDDMIAGGIAAMILVGLYEIYVAVLT